MQQGSKTAGVSKKTGKAFVRDTAPNLKPWRVTVGGFASRAMPSDWEKDGAFMVGIIFYFPRPDAHFNSKGLLKDKSRYKLTIPDVDKLERAILDSLTGIAYTNDNLVCATLPVKLWSEPDKLPGALVSVVKLCGIADGLADALAKAAPDAV